MCVFYLLIKGIKMDKICRECNLLQNINCYVKDKHKKDGRSSRCKSCDRTYQASYRAKNQDSKQKYQKEYRLKNKDKMREYQKEYAKKNEDKIKQYQKEYALNNQEDIIAYQKEYRKTNVCKIKKYQKEYFVKNKDSLIFYKQEYYLKNKTKNKDARAQYYQRNKLKIKQLSRQYRECNKNKIRERRIKYLQNNPIAKLSKTLRCRIRNVLKVNNYRKCDSTYNLLGCSKEFFKEYIISKFSNGMTLYNNNINGWHLDHIKPCSSFDLSDPEQQKLCFHYSNYQPLWATREIAEKYGEPSNYVGNLEKSNKV
jgi:hypothetical protein